MDRLEPFCYKGGMTVAEKHVQARRRILESARPLIGVRGFSAVGLSQILEAANIPKGSFYHYFESKEHFGAALLELYNEQYMEKLDALIAQTGRTGFEKLSLYCQCWVDAQQNGCLSEKCLVVKLAAEVSDLSEKMRLILEEGTTGIVDRLARIIEEGQKDGSITKELPARQMASVVYQTWLGATLLVKVTRQPAPFEEAFAATKQLVAA